MDNKVLPNSLARPISYLHDGGAGVERTAYVGHKKVGYINTGEQGRYFRPNLAEGEPPATAAGGN